MEYNSRGGTTASSLGDITDTVLFSTRESTQSGAHILSLDDGLLHKICASLPFRDLLSLLCTCRTLNKFIAGNNDLWSRLLITHRAAERLTDASLGVLLRRTSGRLEVLEVRGSRGLTGSFLLSDAMKACTMLNKLWMLDCPNLSSAPVVNLVGHIVQTCSSEGVRHRLSSIRLAGSLQIYGKHVRMLENMLVPTQLDVTACPACPKAGTVIVCRMVALMEQLQGSQENAIVRGGEIGCKSCLSRCSQCQEYYCRGHLFNLPCGLDGVCCQCCGFHRCRVCGRQ